MPTKPTTITSTGVLACALIWEIFRASAEVIADLLVIADLQEHGDTELVDQLLGRINDTEQLTIQPATVGLNVLARLIGDSNGH